ncbi:uncharacterized protein LOC124127661 isoform X2 [Haliotis rufescens]|uniref:uncharacterized protein LOC124127661 isoform X2 n=1 Tax=Haliotis rufescens TaxID=6454 RepID=UPI00201F1A3B|nr:uncharacterized protein LOC124127661 isoform X2 [Haliotis rufescens]
MSLHLHILPGSSDKLKKYFLDQLSLHVELNREASSTVSPPVIVIFQPQGRPNDEFDGVVLPFLDKGDPSCKDVILFTALATSQLYGRGFTTDCASRFKYMDKLFITSGHLDTQINRSTFTKLGDILVQEYGFKTSGSQSQEERDQGSIHLGGDQEEVNKHSGSDLRKHVDEDLSPGGDDIIKVGSCDSLGGDANRLENNSARHRLRIIKEEMEGVTTDLQREVEKKWKLLVQLPRILEAVLEKLDQEPKVAEFIMILYFFHQPYILKCQAFIFQFLHLNSDLLIVISEYQINSNPVHNNEKFRINEIKKNISLRNMLNISMLS